MKKILSFFAALSLIFLLTACEHKCQCIPELAGIFDCSETTIIWDEDSLCIYYYQDLNVPWFVIIANTHYINMDLWPISHGELFSWIEKQQFFNSLIDHELIRGVSTIWVRCDQSLTGYKNQVSIMIFDGITSWRHSSPAEQKQQIVDVVRYLESLSFIRQVFVEPDPGYPVGQ